MRNFRLTIADSWKALHGYTMQWIQVFSGYSVLTFTKQIENVILGIDVKVFDTGNPWISEEYIMEILSEEEWEDKQ